MAIKILSILASLAIAAKAATSGDFDVLAFNVAGLPPIFNGNDIPGDKATNSRTIGSRFAQYGYEIIHVQEDFNYHGDIINAANYPYVTTSSGPAAFGSGLNTLSKFPYLDFERIKWNKCSNTDSADCLTPKGFTFMRVAVSDSVFVDLYNLHADAGTTDADLTARASNLDQVATYIEQNSAGNAVVLCGDTNSRYSRVRDVANIYKERNGMKDAWVELIHGGTVPTVENACGNPATNNQCEIVDKIYYRGSRSLSLTATAFNYESRKFLQSDGSILSDHNPITANFTWSVSNFRQSAFSGGPHGNWFNDLDALPSNPKPTTIKFSGANRLDSVGLVLSNEKVFSHGGSGGTATSLNLASDEYWTQAVLCQDKYNSGLTSRTRIFFIEATTSKGRKLSSGTRTSDCATYNAPSGWQIVGYLGRDGDGVDRLAFIYARQ